MLSDLAAADIAALTRRPSRPLVICDVDEVVVHFTRPFEAYLERNGHYLAADSLALDGNIRRIDDGQAAPRPTVAALIEGFFERHTRAQEPIDGAIEALLEFGAHADVVLLSNLPATAAADRRANLAALGLAYPLVVNAGPKGPAVKAIAALGTGASVFIDDSPHFIASARDHAPHVHLVHFMHDERFARHAEPFPYLSLRATAWAEAHPHILELIGTVAAEHPRQDFAQIA